MKAKILYLFLLLSIYASAQVGIGTTTPNAQLDIQSTNQANPSNTDGILIPKIDAFPATNPGANQNGMLVFLTTTVGTNVPGFYYWNHPTAWVPIGNNSNSGWNLNGNAITGGEFVGTTNNNDLIFARNNIRSGFLANSSTAFGVSTLPGPAISLIGNSAFGFETMFFSLSGTNNSAFGHRSLRNNQTGNGNVSIGFESLLNSQGNNNVAVGFSSLSVNDLGFENTGLGFQSNVLSSNLNNATAIGSRATVAASNSLVLGSINGVNGATANVNVGIGTTTPQDRLHIVGNIRMVDGNQAVGKVLTSDTNGTATWQNASANAWGLTGNSGINPATNFIGTTDDNDVVFKRNNLVYGRLTFSSTSFGRNTGVFGTDNSAFGSLSMSVASTNNCSAFGVNTLVNSTGNNNNAFGRAALLTNTSGQQNSAFGNNTMLSNTIGSDNSAFGNEVLRSNVSGNFNSAFGISAMLNNTSGGSNSAFGRATLISNVDGFNNSAFGGHTLNSNISGNANSGFGDRSLQNNTIGEGNSAVGFFAMETNTIGNFNSAFGNNADVAINNLTNATAIGARAEVGTSNSLVLGSINGVNGSTASVNVGIGTTIPSRRLHVVNIGSSGGIPFGTAGFVLESNAQVYQQFLTPSNRESGLLFGNEISNIRAGILFNSGNPDGLSFRTGGNNTRMAITNTGDVGIGTLTPNRQLEVINTGSVFARVTSSDGNPAGIELLRTGNTGNDWRIADSNGELDILRGFVDFTALNSEYRFSTTAFTPSSDVLKNLGISTRRWISVFAINGTIQTSDRREKQDIQPLKYGLDKIMSLQPVTFKWIDNKVDNGSKHIGFIAQELQNTLPEVVVDHEWSRSSESEVPIWAETERLGVNYAEIIPVLVKGMQEQQQLIETLQKRIIELENKINN